MKTPAQSNPNSYTLGSREESGLIDIRTIASALSAAKEKEAQRRAAELRFGGDSASVFEQPLPLPRLAAPLLPLPQQNRFGSGAVIAGVIAAVLSSTVGLTLGVLFLTGFFGKEAPVTP